MFKPLLAANADLSKIAYPVLVSPKLDGIRAVKLKGRLVSRKLLDIPNKFVQAWAKEHLPEGFDGELMLESHRVPFRKVSSAIMSHDGEPDFRYAVFDRHDLGATAFRLRYSSLRSMQWPDRIEVVPHTLVDTLEDLLSFEERYVSLGFEGLMIRSVDGRYKNGRSTVREGILLKLKRFEDEEAVVIGAMEQMTNTNEQERDHLGHAKRSTAKAGKIPNGVLGALICRFSDGTVFEVGSGFIAQQRKELWEMVCAFRDNVQSEPVDGYPGSVSLPLDYFRLATIKHQPPPGGRSEGEAPRFPVFKGFRSD